MKRYVLITMMALLVASLFLVTACSQKGKPPHTEIPGKTDSPQPPGQSKDQPPASDKLVLYQVLSREEVENMTGLKVVALRVEKDIFGSAFGQRIYLAEKEAMPLPDDDSKSDRSISVSLSYSSKQPPEERLDRKDYVRKRDAWKDDPSFQDLGRLAEMAYGYTDSSGDPPQDVIHAVNAECTYIVKGYYPEANLDLLSKMVSTMVENQKKIHDTDTFANLERPKPGSELSVDELRERTVGWYEKVKLGMTIDEVRAITGSLQGYKTEWNESTDYVFTDMSGKTLAVNVTKEGKVIKKDILLKYFDLSDYAQLTPGQFKEEDLKDLYNTRLEDANKRLGTPGIEVFELGKPDSFEKKMAKYYWFGENGQTIRAVVLWPSQEIDEVSFFDESGKMVWP